MMEVAMGRKRLPADPAVSGPWAAAGSSVPVLTLDGTACGPDLPRAPAAGAPFQDAAWRP